MDSLKSIAKGFEELDGIEKEWKDASSKISRESRQEVERQQGLINLRAAEMNENRRRMAGLEQDIRAILRHEALEKAYADFSDNLDLLGVSGNGLLEDAPNGTVKANLDEYQRLNDAIKEGQRQTEEAKSAISKIEFEAKKSLENIKGRLNDDYRKAGQRLSSVYQGFIGDVWASNKPPFNGNMAKAESLPDSLTIGNYILNPDERYRPIFGGEKDPRLPIYLDLRKGGNLFVHLDSEEYGVDETDALLTGLLLQYASYFPAKHLRVGIYSPSFISYARLSAAYRAFMKGNAALTNDSPKTREQLNKLINAAADLSESVNAKLLDNMAEDLHALYGKGIETEAFQLIILHNCSHELALDGLNSLEGLMSTYLRAGVRFIILDDLDKDKYQCRQSGYAEKVDQLFSRLESFKGGRHGFTYRGEAAELPSASAFSAQKAYDCFLSYFSQAKEDEAPYLSYEKIGFGKVSSGKDEYELISIPVASDGANTWEVKFDSGGHFPVANLVLGIPGTGKSTLIDALIINGSMKYAPDELSFQLLDFKDGVSSSVYSHEENKIPHVKVLSENNKPEEAAIILGNIQKEGERRNHEFAALGKEIGLTIRGIADYNRHCKEGKSPRKRMPKLIVVIDECQYLFADDALASQAQDIIKRGRSSGIHLLLATQTVGNSSKFWQALGLVEGIYCFQIAQDDAARLLPRGGYAQRMNQEIPKGSFMCYASHDKGGDIAKVKVAYDGGGANTARYAKAIRERYPNFPCELLVVGDDSPKTIDREQYAKLLEQHPASIPLGVDANDFTLVELPYEEKDPMLLMGGSQEVPDRVFSLLLEAARQRNIKTYLVDASREQRSKAYLGSNPPENFRVYDERDYLEALSAVNAIVKERGKDARQHYEPIFFLLNDMQGIPGFLSNEAYEQQGSPLPSEGMSMAERISLMKARNENKSTIRGADTFLQHLLPNAGKVNVFIVFSLKDPDFANERGDKVLGFAQQGAIKGCAYKLLYRDFDSGFSRLMDDSFKVKILDTLKENMALLVSGRHQMSRVSYYQLEDER